MSDLHPISGFVAHQWFCDHFGHMNVRHYAAAFDDATFLFWSGMGFVADGQSPMPVSLEVKTSFVEEVRAGTVARIGLRLTKIGQKSVGLHFEMRDVAGDRLLAACDVVEVFMDHVSRKSCAIPDAIRERLQSLPFAG